MPPSFYTPIVPGDRGLACSLGEDLPSSQWPVSGGLEARGQRDIVGTVGAVEDLEDFLLLRPELEDTCGVPLNLVPIITDGCLFCYLIERHFPHLVVH